MRCDIGSQWSVTQCRCDVLVASDVDNVVRSCFFQLRQLRSVQRSLADEALHTLVHAFIESCVDYCNALLYGVPGGVMRRLQSVLQNADFQSIFARSASAVTLCEKVQLTRIGSL